MKCSIVKTLDYNVLNGNIAIYQEANGEEPYLFMSEATANAILDDVNKKLLSPISFEASGYIGKYTGCKIYQNDDLEFGEVELR